MSLKLLLDSAYRYAHSLCANEALAEDLVQESWLRVVEHYGADIAKPVLFRTIRNLYVDRWRHEKRFPAEAFDESKAAASTSVADPHDPALDAALDSALRTLSSLERETLFLAVIEGYTATEIAVLTECPRGSVLSRLHRSKRKLAKILDPMSETSAKASVTVLLRRTANGDDNA